MAERQSESAPKTWRAAALAVPPQLPLCDQLALGPHVAEAWMPTMVIVWARLGGLFSMLIDKRARGGRPWRAKNAGRDRVFIAIWA